jgi:hypothetical protein
MPVLRIPVSELVAECIHGEKLGGSSSLPGNRERGRDRETRVLGKAQQDGHKTAIMGTLSGEFNGARVTD